MIHDPAEPSDTLRAPIRSTHQHPEIGVKKTLTRSLVCVFVRGPLSGHRAAPTTPPRFLCPIQTKLVRVTSKYRSNHLTQDVYRGSHITAPVTTAWALTPRKAFNPLVGVPQMRPGFCEFNARTRPKSSATPGRLISMADINQTPPVPCRGRPMF